MIQQPTERPSEERSVHLSPGTGVSWTVGHIHASEWKKKLATHFTAWTAWDGVTTKPVGKTVVKLSAFAVLKHWGEWKEGRIKRYGKGDFSIIWFDWCLFMAKRKACKNSEQQSHVPYKATGLDGLNRFGEPLQGKKYCQEQITTLSSQRLVW